MSAFKKFLFIASDTVKEFFTIVLLWLPEIRPAPQKPEIPVIVSMTTYPPRIKSAWISIETLLRQTVRPMKLLLVLSIEEFPTQKLPFRIRAQTRRGLEILWINRTSGSYDKLIPVRKAFPGATIVTFDDDKYFPSRLLERLHDASRKNPESVVGSRGWVIRRTPFGTASYGSNWVRATPGARGRNLITPGGNGCLYPSISLDLEVDNLDNAIKVCPTADDIWFWAAIQKKGSQIVSLGDQAHRPVKSLGSGHALSKINEVANANQFQKALDFWEIRSSLDAVLLEVNEANG